MEIINKDEFNSKKEAIKEKILDGEVFIHPTDTIYGLGCNAQNKKAVDRLRAVKERPSNPFSVMAPNKEWIYENCVVPKEAEKWLKKLPGPYTFIFTLKDKKAIAESVNPGLDSVGVRIPDHWFHELAKELEVPLVTTSANLVGEPFMTSMENLDPKIKGRLNLIIYEGEKNGKPSQVIDFTGKEKKILRK
jgi:L-threonylcarbamoyladenylate synthase